MAPSSSRRLICRARTAERQDGQDGQEGWRTKGHEGHVRDVMLRARSVLAALVLMAVSPALAQSEATIYVQYEGFIRQTDGSLILSFGYFNTGDTDIAIPIGNRNQFLPAPANRRQTTLFAKGRHRSACVLVAPKGFNGDLRWQVQNGATVSTTTMKVLDPNYALEENSEKRATNGVNFQSGASLTCQEPKPVPGRPFD